MNEQNRRGENAATGFRDAPAARAVLHAAAAAALLLLASCARPPDLLLFLDPYVEAVLRAEGVIPGGFRRASPGIGRIRVEMGTPGPDAEGLLRGVLERYSPRGVYSSPLLTAAAVGVAGDYTDTLFVVDGPLPEGTFPAEANVRELRYDTAAAYGEAGRILGRMLALSGVPSGLRQAVQGQRVSGSVGILSVRAGAAGQQELRTFRENLALSGRTEEVAYRELEGLDDKARARRQLERMREEGIGVFVLKTASLTGFCLEVLEKAGGLAIVDGGAGIEAYSDVLLLSVEKDFGSALRQMVLAGTREAAAASAQPDSIAASVRLRWWAVPPEEVEIYAGEIHSDESSQP